MKKFIRVDFKRLVTESNKFYTTTSFRRDKKDLKSEGGFMGLNELREWYSKEYLFSDDNASTLSLQSLEKLWLENGDNTVSYTAEKVNEDRFNNLLELFPNAEIVTLEGKGFEANGDILFLDQLKRANTKYEILA